MNSEVMGYFGLEKALDDLGDFETPNHQHLHEELKKAIHQGRLIAICGINRSHRLEAPTEAPTD